MSYTVMLGAFPPPVGGAARNNAMLFDSMRAGGADVRKIDISASKLNHSRDLSFHTERISRNLAGLAKAVRLRNKQAALYLVPDGGAGAWYSLGHVRAAASGYGRIILHHHTFRYIDRPSRPVELIVKALPERTTHVFLSDGMASQFQLRYGSANAMVASNARFVADEAGRDPALRAAGPLRLGHLSNLCDDKGFFDVAATFEAVRERGVDAELCLAGPVVGEEVQRRLDELIRTGGGRVRHLGPVFGAEKRDFYRNIDLFLFPTNFDQEAAPSVIYESLAAGRPVLSTRRGCIPEMITGERGLILRPRTEFVTGAVEYISKFDSGETAGLARAQRIKAEMRIESARSRDQYAALMALMGAKNPGQMVQEY